METLEDRLQSATASPAVPSHRFAQLIQDSIPYGKPVLVAEWDWFLHPLQVAEAKEAGAAGIIGVIANVLGNGSPIMSSFAAAIGLDAPVEVVNKTEVTRLGDAGSTYVPYLSLAYYLWLDCLGTMMLPK
ncbi:hypothetical protein WJX82_007139 [Trebouxia sp. C0006]